MSEVRSRQAVFPAIFLAIGTSALIAGGVPRTGQPSPSLGAHDLVAAGIARFETFVPALPAGLPAWFEVNVPLGEATVTLEMTKTSNRGERFRVLVDRGGGLLEEVPEPEVRTYTGTIVGDPGSRVGLSLLPLGPQGSHMVAGMVHQGNGRSWAIQPLSELVEQSVRVPAGTHASFASEDSFLDGGGCALGQPGFSLDAFRSDLSRAMADGKLGRTRERDSGSDEGGIAGATPWQVVIACDTDFEFFQRNGSSVASTVNDMEMILNNVNVVYDRDLDIVFEIGTLVVRSTSDDPYTATTMDGRLTEFRNAWATAPESGIFRNISHLFSGFGYTGSASGTLGIAYLGVVCSGVTQFQYGAVQGRQSFTTTNTNNRIALSAHELGHNWNAEHCDSAGSANCNIMCSGLGGCGGISGSNLRFNPVSVNAITNFRNAVSCDFQRPGPVVLPFEETFPTLTLSTARWTYNDGGVITTAAPNEPSAPNSLALNSTGAGPYDQDEVRTNFMLMQGITDVRVRVRVLRTSAVESGKSLRIEYFSSALKWVELGTLVSDGVGQTVFATHEWTLPSSASHDRFRLRFRTEGTDSTDTWYIDDVGVFSSPPPPCPADIDGNRDVNAIDLSIVLANWGGSGGSGDVDGSGTIDGIDLGSVLAGWGPCP